MKQKTSFIVFEGLSFDDKEKFVKKQRIRTLNKPTIPT